MSERMMTAARSPRLALIPGLVALFLSVGSIANAQSAVGGLIFDPNGAVAARIPLTLKHVSTGTTWTTKSSSLAHYYFGPLTPGDYVITVNVDPFSPVEVPVTLVQDVWTSVDIHLQFRGEERVDVRTPNTSAAEGPRTTFTSDLIDALFLPNGRTLQSLQTHVPGIVVTDSVGTLAQFTAVGQRRFSNRLTIDGISADLAADTRGLSVGEAGSGALPAVATSGGTQTLIPLDAIGEVEVRTINANVAHAQTPGAQTSIVTRAGADRFSPTAFAATRPDRLSARDWFSNAGLKPLREVHFRNMGVSAGGPIVRGRLFYHAAWERQDIDRPVTTTVQVPSLSLRETAPEAVRPLFDAFPLPNGPERGEGLADLTHRFPLTSSFSVMSVRSDLRLTDTFRGFVRLNWGRSNGDAVGATRLQVPPPAYTRTETAVTRTATAGLSSTSSEWTHDTRFNVSEHRGDVVASPARFGNAAPIPYALLAPTSSTEADTFLNVFLFPSPAGVILSGPLARTTQTQAQFTDTWSLTKGRHLWTGGVDFRQVWNEIDPPGDLYGYRLRNAKDLLAERIPQVSIGHNAPARVSRPSWSAFVEDTIRLTTRASLNLGLRYGVQPPPVDRAEREPLTFDFETLPEIAERPPGQPLWPTQINFAPRVGLTYQLGRVDGRQTTLRIGWGLVFDELTTPGLSAFGDGYPYVVIRLGGSSPFPIPEGLLASRDIFPMPFEPGTIIEYYAFARGLRSPRTHAWHLGLDRTLGHGQQLSMTYAGTMGSNLIYRHEYFGGAGHTIHAYSNDGTSDYHALLVNYTRRMSRSLEGRLAYTWSHAIDTDSGETLTDQPPPKFIPLSLNRASADFDRRHVLHAWMSYRVPTPPLPNAVRALCRDWQIDASIVTESSAPVSVTVTRTLGTGPYFVRPDIVENVPVWLIDPTSPGGRRLNPAAFSNTQETRQGTLGRNTIRGFPLRQLNVAVSRRLLMGERAIVDLRMEVFNVLNIPSFGPPNGALFQSGFGQSLQSYAETLGSGSLAVGGLVPIQQAGGPRAIQLAIRLGL